MASFLVFPYAMTPGRSGTSAIQRPSSSRSSSILMISSSRYKYTANSIYEQDGQFQLQEGSSFAPNFFPFPLFFNRASAFNRSFLTSRFRCAKDSENQNQSQ